MSKETITSILSKGLGKIIIGVIVTFIVAFLLIDYPTIFFIIILLLFISQLF